MAIATATAGYQENATISDSVRSLGSGLTRFGLVAVFVWIGAMKFTGYEAAGIQPLVANSPLMSWLYNIFSVQGFSNALGGLEIAIGLMIAAQWFSPKIAAAGSALAAVLFLGTLSFMLSTPPVWEATLGGFPALSIAPGQFLLKDLPLLGASIWTLAQSLDDIR